MNNKKFENLSVEDAVKKISESKYGLHCMMIYPNIGTLRDFYTYYLQRQITLKNEIVLFNPFYETIGKVKQNLSLGHIGVDNYRYDNDISLIIADSLDQYFGKMSMVEFSRLVKVSAKKQKDGVSIVSDMRPYFYNALYQELVNYELFLPQGLNVLLKGLCVYSNLTLIMH